MADGQFRCTACRRLHRRRVAGQRYCGASACQRERRNAWRRQRYATDDAYRLTARESTKAWLEAQGGASRYYRAYREERAQRRRDQANSAPKQARRQDRVRAICAQKEMAGRGANSDANDAEALVTTGRYLVVAAERAKSDATIVHLLAITDDSSNLQRTTGFSGPCGDVTLGP